MEATQAADAEPVRRRKRRGHGWERPHKKKSVSEGPGPGRPRKEQAPTASHKLYYSKRELALMLLRDDWEPFLNAEVEQYQTMGLLEKAQEFFNVTPCSTYLLQKRTGAENLAIRSEKSFWLVVDWCAQALHAKNKDWVPFSMAAKSAAHLAHNVPRRAWEEDAGLVSKKLAIEYVHLMTSLRTPPSFVVHGRIFWRIYDQVYRRDAHNGKKGETRASGAVLADGEKKTFGRLVFVNALDVPLPRAPQWCFTQLELDQVMAEGPFTEGFQSVYPELTPHRV